MSVILEIKSCNNLWIGTKPIIDWDSELESKTQSKIPVDGWKDIDNFSYCFDSNFSDNENNFDEFSQARNFCDFDNKQILLRITCWHKYHST